MRNIILPLLLANLLVLAWNRWIGPENAADPTQLARAGNEARLVLYVPARASVPSAAYEPAMIPAAVARRCERIGPFDDGQDAARIAGQLGRRGLQADVMEETGEIWVGHWVQITDLGSGDAAIAALDRLAKVGIKDAYVVRTEPTIDLSLGVFRESDGAEGVIRLAGKAGLEAASANRYRSGSRHWVNVDTRGRQSLDLAELQLGSSQILRREEVVCRPVADIVADADVESLESVAETNGPE